MKNQKDVAIATITPGTEIYYTFVERFANVLKKGENPLKDLDKYIKDYEFFGIKREDTIKGFNNILEEAKKLNKEYR